MRHTHFAIGDPVVVDLCYRGSGSYSPDGAEGNWFITRCLGDGNYRIAKTPDAPYAYVIHACRIKGTPEWRSMPGKDRSDAEYYREHLKGCQCEGCKH